MLLQKILQSAPKLSFVQFSRGLRTPYREEKVVLNEDGSIIVCWHPEPKFPYELTQPIPRNIPTEQT